MELQKGDLVRVQAYGGQVLDRRLVEVRGRTTVATTDEEYQAAKKERRGPICIGFPLADMVKKKTEP